MTKITFDAKRQLESDIIAAFPDFSKRIGLQGYSCLKVAKDKELFHINDKDKTYLSTPLYKLDGDFGQFDAAAPVEFKMAATLFKDDLLTIHNIDFEFHDKDDQLLKKLVHLNSLTEYFDNFKEVEEFILTYSDIVDRVLPTLKFNFDGQLSDIGVVFKYSERYLNNGLNLTRDRYYTNSVSLYNPDYNKFYKITTPQEALVFSKMSFLSIHDENIQELFDCKEWEDLYAKMKENPEAFFNLYDMTKI